MIAPLKPLSHLHLHMYMTPADLLDVPRHQRPGKPGVLRWCKRCCVLEHYLPVTAMAMEPGVQQPRCFPFLDDLPGFAARLEPGRCPRSGRICSPCFHGSRGVAPGGRGSDAGRLHQLPLKLQKLTKSNLKMSKARYPELCSSWI